MDDLSEGDLQGRSKGDLLGVWAKQQGVQLLSFLDGTSTRRYFKANAIVENLGKSTPRQPIPPTPETITTINYTSGTTGMPKGAVLTHAAAVAALVGPKLMGAIEGVPGDTMLSFLPLAHIYERENINMCIYAGMRVGFFHGDVTQVPSHSTCPLTVASRRYPKIAAHHHRLGSSRTVQADFRNSSSHYRCPRFQRETLSYCPRSEVRPHGRPRKDFPSSRLGSSLES